MLPPPPLLALPGKSHEVLALGGIRDVEEIAQITYVPCAGTALPGFDPAQLGRGEQEPGRDLLGGQPAICAQLAQQRASSRRRMVGLPPLVTLASYLPQSARRPGCNPLGPNDRF